MADAVGPPAAPVVQTARLCLRRMAATDIEPVARMFSDPEVMRYSITGTRDREASVAWLERSIAVYDEHGFGFLAAIERKSGEYVGHVGLLPQEVDGQREVEIGYWLRRQSWGLGYATEAARACRDHGLDALDRERLISIIVPSNERSRRVAQKIGMRMEKQTAWKGVDVCVYALTRVSCRDLETRRER